MTLYRHGSSPGVPAKRFLDIEAALRWAYRDELPKRGRRGGMWANVDYPSSSWMSQAASDHGPPDGPAREPGFPPAAGDPHPDSLIIEAAVLALAAFAGYQFDAEQMTSLTCGVPVPEDDLGGVARWDPVMIGIEAIACMPGTVTINARMATRPKWSAGLPRPSWMVGKNGKPKVLIDVPIVGKEPFRDPFGREIVEIGTFPCPPSHKDVYRAGAYCPIAWRPDPRRLVTERAEHCAWHVGLEILAAKLTGQLIAIAVLAPAAAWAPWQHGAPDRFGAPPQLFAGLRETLYRRETREQAAARRRTARRRLLREAEEMLPRPWPGNRGRRRRGDPAA